MTSLINLAQIGIETIPPPPHFLGDHLWNCRQFYWLESPAIESLLMSGYGQGHEPPENVSRIFGSRFQCSKQKWNYKPKKVSIASLVPRLSGTRILHVWRTWYIFSCDHDVTKLGTEFLEQK